jgi:hypothetical protein
MVGYSPRDGSNLLPNLLPSGTDVHAIAQKSERDGKKQDNLCM